MKNTNRARGNVNPVATGPQSKMRPPELAITVFDFEKDTNICQQNLSARESAALERACKKTGLTLKIFIKMAISQAVESSEEIPPAPSQNLKLIDRKTGQVIYDPAEHLSIFVSQQTRRHLRVFSRGMRPESLEAAAGLIVALGMLNRPFIQNAAINLANYAYNEGFKRNDQMQVIESLLAAR